MANMVFCNIVLVADIMLKCLECLKSTKLMHSILDMIEAHLRSKTAPLPCGLQGWLVILIGYLILTFTALKVFTVSFIKLLKFLDWHRIGLILTHVTQSECPTVIIIMIL